MAKNPDNNTQFRINRANKIREIYADEVSTSRRFNRTISSSGNTLTTAAQVRDALNKAITDSSKVVQMSKELYAKNPIYMQIIDYLCNMFTWNYKVTPHKVYTKSKAKARKIIKEDDFKIIYNLMLEVVDGISIETKFPAMLQKLFVEGAVYFATVSDDESLLIETILLPTKYCRKIGDTQFGTGVIEFDFSYFDDLGLTKDKLELLFKSYPKEFKTCYNKYKKDVSNMRWQQLNPFFNSCLMMNEYGIPTIFYILGSILDYEKYQDNELERNENLLHYIVVQTMPHYEDKLIFEMDEVKELHHSMRKIIDKGDRTKLITTFGDIKVERVSENNTAENQVLSKSFQAIFNNAGFNSGLFTSESVTALKMSLLRDRGFVWKFVQSLVNFYNITINNWFDFKTYEANLDILPISPYTYSDDIKVYKDNATLGVGKVDYFIAAGVKQKNLSDMLDLEDYLHLDRVTPMQTSYTQTAEDRENEDSGDDEGSTDNPPVIEPAGKDEK